MVESGAVDAISRMNYWRMLRMAAPLEIARGRISSKRCQGLFDLWTEFERNLDFSAGTPP